MKSKGLVGHLVLEMSENRANARQVSGHFPSSQARYTARFALVVLLMVIFG
jgi:hypothetical protein